MSDELAYGEEFFMIIYVSHVSYISMDGGSVAWSV